MKKIISILSIVLAFGCQSKDGVKANSSGSDDRVYYPDTTILGTIRQSKQVVIDQSKKIPLSEVSYFYSKHGDEILKTLEIVEVDSIPKTPLALVFYRYTVGANIDKESAFFRKVDGKWIIVDTYFSSYDEDPFHNKMGDEGKRILKKKGDWDEIASARIWNQ